MSDSRAILIADDHEMVRKGLRAVLQSSEEWTVCGEAVNGRDAVEKARKLKPDVVIMDITMPELNGLEATRIIRDPKSGVRNHNVPIIALTAKAMKGDRELCLETGMDDYIPKPIDPSRLFETIEKNLARKRVGVE